MTVFGEEGADTVITDSLAAEVHGGAGDDTFVSGSAADAFYGDDGRDTISYAKSAAGVTVALGDLNQQGTGSGDKLYGVENIIGSGFADTLSGSNDANAIYGGDGDDVINGNAGNDTLAGDGGTDMLRGGAGDDTYILGDGDAEDVIVEDANAGTDTVGTMLSSFTLADNVENLVFIGIGAFTG
ncbi:calcium-binding protein, partial [Dactylosporangium matsuzakiense]|uniref:calcium-binding protein n=1 Tax=Dactylosporangium matsuzakiense TaxID=53360 RepID=UPI0022F30C1D